MMLLGLEQVPGQPAARSSMSWHGWVHEYEPQENLAREDKGVWEDGGPATVNESYVLLPQWHVCEEESRLLV